MTMILTVIGPLGTDTKRLVQGLENLKIRGRVECISKIGRNTEKKPGDFRRLLSLSLQ